MKTKRILKWTLNDYGTHKTIRCNGIIYIPREEEIVEIFNKVEDLLTEVEQLKKEVHELESMRNELISDKLGHILEVRELDKEIQTLRGILKNELLDTNN